jgi:LCP family protein required for cell wall assembly
MSSDPVTARARHRGSRAGRSPGLRRGAIRSVGVVAAAVSCALLLISGYAWYSYTSLNRNLNTVAVEGLGRSAAPPGAPGAPAGGTGRDQNILLVGLDSRDGLSDAEKRHLHLGVHDVSTSTDTIVLVHIPANGKKATLVSIPRDTWVNIPHHPAAKINAAFADGYYYEGAKTPKDRQGKGASRLVSVVKALTGEQIDQYVQVGFAGFEEIVDALHTVPVTLCRDVSDPHYSGFVMSAGHHELNPQQALEFVRERHNIPGPVKDDFAREERQRYFLRQTFDRIVSANTLLSPSRLQHLISAVDDAFTFGNQNIDLVKFAEQMSALSAGNIKGVSIPTHGTNAQGGLIVRPAEVHSKVRRLFYGPQKPRTSNTRHGKRRTKPRSCVY